MDLTSANTPPKRSRAKTPAQPTTAKPKIERKPASASRKRAPTPAETAPQQVVGSEPDLRGMIETAAFFLAASRGFVPGHELDDWLEAERMVRAKHM